MTPVNSCEPAPEPRLFSLPAPQCQDQAARRRLNIRRIDLELERLALVPISSLPKLEVVVNCF